MVHRTVSYETIDCRFSYRNSYRLPGSSSRFKGEFLLSAAADVETLTYTWVAKEGRGRIHQ